MGPNCRPNNKKRPRSLWAIKTWKLSWSTNTTRAGVSVDEEEEVLIETRRIIQINNIIDRIADKDDIVRYWLSNPIGIKAEKMREDLFGQDPVPFGPAYVEPLPDCPQFEQIKSYLFENRLKLALDTMGWLPENTLYHYIRWNRG